MHVKKITKVFLNFSFSTLQKVYLHSNMGFISRPISFASLEPFNS